MVEERCDCLEGLASGPAIEGRWGCPAADLPPEHPAWALEAEYLALALVNLICTLSPQRIVMGGGVMDQTHLFPEIRTRVQHSLHDYIQSAAIADALEEYAPQRQTELPVIVGRGGPRAVHGLLALQRALEQLGWPYTIFGHDTPITMVAQYAGQLCQHLSATTAEKKNP